MKTIMMIKTNNNSFISSCFLTYILLGACLLATISIKADEATGNDPHFYDFIRPRLGHFSKVDGYLKLFEEYKANVLAVTDKELKNVGINDWRNVRPTGELCVDFLTGFQVKDYTLTKPFDIILLDACLDWLFDTTKEKKLDLDRFNDISRSDYEKLNEDKELKKIFSSTKFKTDEVPKELKEKLHEYFGRLLKIFSDNPKSGCNGLYLAAYDDFIEDVYLGDCEDDDKCEYFGKYGTFDGIKKDSYLNQIIDSTKQATKNCYGVVQKQMVDHMHQAYEDEPMHASVQRKFKTINSKAARQSAEKKWGREMMRILQIASNRGADDVVDLNEVIKILKGVKDDDEDVKENFTAAVAAYAIEEVDPKDTAGDANGRARYGKAMADLCKPYIDKQSFLVRTGGSHLWKDDPTQIRQPFEFFDMVYSLIRITNHLSFYKTTKEKFEKDVLKNGWEALYLATFACQLISTTWGEISYDTNKAEFNVMLRKNFHDSIDDWPIEVMYDEFTKIEAVKPVETLSKQVSSKRMKFSLPKFRFNRTKDGQADNVQQDQADKVQDKPGFSRPPPPTKRPGPGPIKSFRPVARPAPIITKPAPQMEVSQPEPEPEPEPFQASKPSDVSTNNVKSKMSQETLEMFKRLHKRLPKDMDKVEIIKESKPIDTIETTVPKTNQPKLRKPASKKQNWKSFDILSM